MENFTDRALEKFGYDTPILVNDFRRAFPSKSRATLYRLIDAAVKRGELGRYCRGVYYFSQQTPFGKTAPLPEDVVARLWLTDEGKTIGYISGGVLANRVGMTTQVPACLEIVTNRETSRVREVVSFGGWRKIILRRPRQTVTAENVDALRFLDLVTEETIVPQDDALMGALKELAKKTTKAQLVSCAGSYPSKTAKRLIECERHHVFA